MAYPFAHRRATAAPARETPCKHRASPVARVAPCNHLYIHVIYICYQPPPRFVMEDFEVAPPESFSPAIALERMLRLLLALFEDVAEHRHVLFIPSQNASASPLEEAFASALPVARDDIHTLISDLRTVDFTLEEKLHLRLEGAMLRFRMLAIQRALEEAGGGEGDARHRDPAHYKRSLEVLLDLMDEPLGCLVQVLDGPRGPVEFKSTLKALLQLKSATAT